MNPDENGYNGWKNFETWLANMEFAEGLGDMWAEEEEKFETPSELAAALRESVDGLFEDVEAEGTTVVLSTSQYELLYSWASRAMMRIDWLEIARHYEFLIKPQEETR